MTESLRRKAQEYPLRVEASRKHGERETIDGCLEEFGICYFKRRILKGLSQGKEFRILCGSFLFCMLSRFVSQFGST